MKNHTLTMGPSEAPSNEEERDIWERKMKKRSGYKTSSDYYGVTFEKNSHRWRALVWDQRKTVHLGSFGSSPEDEIAAAEAVDRYLVSKGELPRNELLKVFRKFQKEFFSHYLSQEFSNDQETT